jgi:hypothetical protein
MRIMDSRKRTITRWDGVSTLSESISPIGNYRAEEFLYLYSL